jgi:rubrerythrin
VAATPVLLGGAGQALAATDDAAKKRAQAELAVALRLEQAAVVAYEAIANGGRLSGRATTLFRGLLADDRQHADQLVTALEALSVKPPIPPRRANIPGLTAVTSEDAAALFAIALEERTIGAYSAAVRDLSDANLLRTVTGAMGTDGQHLVVLRQLARRPAVPRAFERGAHP